MLLAWPYISVFGLPCGQSIMRVGGINHKGIFIRIRTPRLAARVLCEFWFR